MAEFWVRIWVRVRNGIWVMTWVRVRAFSSRKLRIFSRRKIMSCHSGGWEQVRTVANLNYQPGKVKISLTKVEIEPATFGFPVQSFS